MLDSMVLLVALRVVLVSVKPAVLSIPPLLAVPKVAFLINYNVLLPLLDIILLVLK